MKYLTIALPKGRLAELTLELLEKAGIQCKSTELKSRKLIIEDDENQVRFFMAKPSDVPVYVEYGVADLGVVGKDTLMEESRDLYEVLNLGFGACRMAVAGPIELIGKLDDIPDKRVATKYPKIARDYFELVKKESIEIIKLNGSVELAPLVGLSEVIVDIVESGRTLKENNLVVLEEICDISARLVVNKVSMKMKNERIRELISEMRKELGNA
ncbi:MAG: ATP phosphoribosyltransferase [Clostridiales bacterium]|nr:ATP phosphoribosyltransferase [Clostridiales bacterium]